MNTEESLDHGRMTLFEHLAELRSRLIKTVLAVLVGTAIMWTAYPAVFDFLVQPYCEAIDESGNTFVTTRALESRERSAGPPSSSPIRSRASPSVSRWPATAASPSPCP